MSLHKAKRSGTRKYVQLPVGMRFKVPGSTHTFIKLARSNALDQSTDKDAIFALSDPCIQVGFQPGFYPVKLLA